ncbi:hypothetical protein J6590_059794 [Homalodisca vitripennis]|nr:hypothetical protein J6590_059794 [Homalodisca vitripennis]
MRSGVKEWGRRLRREEGVEECGRRLSRKDVLNTVLSSKFSSIRKQGTSKCRVTINKEVFIERALWHLVWAIYINNEPNQSLPHPHSSRPTTSTPLIPHSM